MMPFMPAGMTSKPLPSKGQISTVGTTVFLVCVAAGFAAAMLIHNRAWLWAGIVIGLYFLFSIRVAEQWEKAAVLRLGRYIGLRGPRTSGPHHSWHRRDGYRSQIRGGLNGLHQQSSGAAFAR